MGIIHSTANHRHCPVSAQIDTHLADLDEADRLAESLDDLVTNWLADPVKCREADDWAEGTQDGEHYAAVERAMAELGSLDWRQIAAPERTGHVDAVLNRVHALAKVHYAARVDSMRSLAQDEMRRLENEANAARADMLRGAA